jgi:predicted metalloendopeptidase
VISASDVQRKWQRLGARRDHNEWRMWPSEAQAYYSFPGNDVGKALFIPGNGLILLQIVITAGTIQTPWFAPEWYLASNGSPTI